MFFITAIDLYGEIYQCAFKHKGYLLCRQHILFEHLFNLLSDVAILQTVV